MHNVRDMMCWDDSLPRPTSSPKSVSGFAHNHRDSDSPAGETYDYEDDYNPAFIGFPASIT